MQFLSELLPAGDALSKSAVAVLAVLLLASFDLFRRFHHRSSHILFACVFGTILSTGLIKSTAVFLQPGVQENPHVMALAVLLIVLGWRALFGPWEPETKAVILGTFLFWLSFRILAQADAADRNLRLIAAAAALVPAAVWCMLFLRYHTERFGAVLLMFFAGMLSTVPILFYDALVRHQVELQFFLFRITPENFSRNSHAFISGQLSGAGPVRSLLIVSFVSFLIVGVIEELSKFWVLGKSGRRIFTSIDDVMQLSIVVAIGFAFAENIVNPSYFMGFVRDYLLRPDAPDFVGFLSNALGRSVLTSMVHIVSTGVLGYFLGLAIFAGPYLHEQHARGRRFAVLNGIRKLLQLAEISVFRTEMLTIGIASAITLHACFNFLVTLPDMLPGRPQSVGAAFGGGYALLDSVPLLLVPALLYVVGGFWLLTALFLRKENMRERGHLVTREEFAAETAS